MKRPALAFMAPFLVAAMAIFATLVLYPFVHFARPDALWWLVGLVIFACLWAWRAHTRQRRQDLLLHMEAARRHLPSWSPRRAAVRFTLFSLAGYGLILASAQPQWGERTRNIQRKGTDIAIVFDASRSMLAEDIGPNRLRAATGELNTLLQKLDGDRVGLVVFAGIAFTQSPLTSDYGAIRLYLDRVNPDAIPAQGTAIGAAIQEAHRLLTGGNDPDFKRAPHQLILVISDGEDHETNPIEAAQAAREDGIHVYTVGIGTSAGGRIPLYGKNGTVERYLTDRQGQVVVTKLEDQQLQDIALSGDGAYTRYDGSGSTVGPLLHKIQSYDKDYLSSVMRSHYVNRGEFFLLPAFLMLFLALMLPERPPAYQRKRWWQIFVIGCIALLSSSCDFKREDPHVRNAIEAARVEDFTKALDEMDRANQDAKSQYEFHFNRGRMHDGNHDAEAAQDDFLHALGASKESLRAASLIGVGNTLVQQEKFREAIIRYERALLLNPSNHIARHNLEIAHRLLYPACNMLDDPFEPNDRLQHASLLPTTAYSGPYKELYQQWTQQQLDKNESLRMPEGYDLPHEGDKKQKKSLVLCGGNEDWFLLPLQGGEEGDITVQFRRLREDDGGPPLPARIPPSSVRIAVINSQHILSAVDEGIEDAQKSDTIPAKSLARHIDLEGASEKNGPWFLVISGDEKREYTYDINVRITPLCSALEDAFEPNNSPEDAASVETGEYQGQLCNKNDDWFTKDLAPGDNLFVDIEPAPVEKTDDTRMKSAFSTVDARPLFTRQKENGRIAWASGEIQEKQRALWGLSTQNKTELPYKLNVYHFPACPDGNDRFEPNDQPSDATALTPEQQELRHLRLCADDEDWFVMQFPQEDDTKKKTTNKDDEPPAPKAFSALAEVENPDTQIRIELWDPQTGRRLAVSQRVTPPSFDHSPPTSEQDQDGQPSMPVIPAGAIAATDIAPDTQAVVVRVFGDPTFYNLRFPDTQPPQEQNPSDADSDESDENNEENQSDQNQNADQDDDQRNDQNEEDNAENDDQRDGADNQQDQVNQATQETPDLAPEEHDDERDALKQLLESLGNDDVNLQLQQAIEGAPPTQSKTPW